uniref:X-prolyl aminopeptidase 2 n=1 Tax=Catharus ustulatus TaxID=91951 RepID=A0A8C3V5S8_CATUS
KAPKLATNTSVRLAALRGVMRTQGTHAYIVPSTDAHMSEYISERDARLGWLTGFSGSAGTAVVTQDKATLWTDSRYWTQAERELDCNWELQRTRLADTGGHLSLPMGEHGMPMGCRFTRSTNLWTAHPLDTWNSYSRALHGSGRTLLPLETNLVDQAWGDQRPLPSSSEIYSLPAEFTGSSWQEKVAGIRQQMEEHSRRPTAVLLSGLEETAWLFNLRGDDIPYNPVFYSYTLLTNTTIRWATRPCGHRAWLRGMWVLQARGRPRVTVLWPPLGPEGTGSCATSCLPSQEKLLEENYSPVMTAKAVKNAHEQEMLRAAHVRDAVAVIQYLLWLEKTVPQGQVDEFSGAQHIDALRWSVLRPSFQSISASGLNAALAHYSPSNGSSRALSVREMYLFDTGGQYLCVGLNRDPHHCPTPRGLQSQEQEGMKGPTGSSAHTPPLHSPGRNVESFARRALWNVGLNYGHGTGHGIGNFLSVHEWPVGFQSNNVPLEAGMFTSIEPGYYRDGEFGIRIEDVALVVEAQTEGGSIPAIPAASRGAWLQIQYLNSYYEKIRAQVGPELRRQRLEEEYAWLQESTEPFPLSSARTVALAPLALAPLLSVLLSGLGA